MATEVAFFNPAAPISLMYTYDIGVMEALPNGAAETAPIESSPPVGTTGLPGKKGERCFATPMAPTPGPPPP